MNLETRQRLAREADIELLRKQFTDERLQRMREVAFNRQRGLTIIMEDVWDPHNMGAISRTADGFGIQYIHYTSQESFDLAQVGFLSSSTANRWIDYYFHGTHIEQAIHTVQDQSYKLVATSADDRAVSLYEVDWTQYDKLALLVGNENTGVSETALHYADISITIPMRGMVQSYNVSVATAIILAEITRQRDKSNTDFRLPEVEANAILESFIRRSY